MAELCLTLIGTASIQTYLFRSNRLKENLGASWVVADALERWGRAPWSSTYQQKVFIGGVNAALIFAGLEIAKKALREWSTELLKDAPGLRVLAVHEAFQPGELSHAFRRAQRALFLSENRAAHGWELGSLPVVRPCESTGMAASEFEDGQWLSAEAAAKRRAAVAANSDFSKRYSAALETGTVRYQLSEQLDDLRDDEGASQIAIVHADGNGVGQILDGIIEEAGSDEQRISRLAAASLAIKTLAQQAFVATLRDLTAALPKLELQGIQSNTGMYPVRPIIDGGDDLTFICHGKLALTLTARYLRHFEREAANQMVPLGVSLTSCAGVLIMPGKFPFARGYQLAEQLAASAKASRKRADGSGSWLDFQLIMEGSDVSLGEFRRKAYHFTTSDSPSNSLLRRPYRLEGGEPRESWQGFEEKWKVFRSSAWPRSRAKLLFETLSKGPKFTEELLADWAASGLKLPEPWTAEPLGGRTIQVTPYFDPLEFMDFHIDSSLLDEEANHVVAGN